MKIKKKRERKEISNFKEGLKRKKERERVGEEKRETWKYDVTLRERERVKTRARTQKSAGRSYLMSHPLFPTSP